MSDAPLRVGVVGIGFGQAVLVPAFRSDPSCEVVAIAASTEERARRVADRLGVPRGLGDWRALVADPAVDAIAVAVPPSLQPAVVVAAAGSGKHVFCEKPAALTVSAARDMLEAVRAGRVVHAIDFEFPELPAWAGMKAACVAGEIGELQRVSVDWRIRTHAGPDRATSWKARDDEGGGLWGGFLAHTLYHLEWVGGPLTRLRASRSLDARVIALSGEFASGATASVTIDAAVAGGWGHHIEVIGTRGTLRLDNGGPDHAGPFTLSSNGAVVRADRSSGQEDGRIGAVARLARRFLDAIREDRDVTPGLIQGVRVQELLEAVCRSERDEAWMAV